MDKKKEYRYRYVLIEDVFFFGYRIPKGTVYIQKEDNADIYECFMVEGTVIYQKPDFNLSYRIVKNNQMFIQTINNISSVHDKDYFIR